MSGDKVWWFDFSEVTTPGTYAVVDIDKGLRSPEFQIDDRVYRKVLKAATRMFFYQRAGLKKTAEAVGPDWEDAASHMGPGQDPQTRPWQARRGPSVRSWLPWTNSYSISDTSETKDFTEAGSTLATITSIRVGRLVTLLSCCVLIVRIRLRSATTLA